MAAAEADVDAEPEEALEGELLGVTLEEEVLVDELQPAVAASAMPAMPSKAANRLFGDLKGSIPRP